MNQYNIADTPSYARNLTAVVTVADLIRFHTEDVEVAIHDLKVLRYFEEEAMKDD